MGLRGYFFSVWEFEKVLGLSCFIVLEGICLYLSHRPSLHSLSVPIVSL